MHYTYCVCDFLFCGYPCMTKENHDVKVPEKPSCSCNLEILEENLVFETVQSGPYSSFECFLCSLRN